MEGVCDILAVRWRRRRTVEAAVNKSKDGVAFNTEEKGCGAGFEGEEKRLSSGHLEARFFCFSNLLGFIMQCGLRRWELKGPKRELRKCAKKRWGLPIDSFSERTSQLSCGEALCTT